ncbi:MAG: hypothetical protein WCL32_11690 [Planctomycetota bacterium]
MTLLRAGFVFAFLLALALFVAPADACLFCSEQRGPTLSDDFSKASAVLLGSCLNPKLGTGGLEDSSTEFIVEEVVKPHALIKDQKKILLPRFIADTKSKHIIFADVYKGKLDFYRGVPVEADSAMVKYLKGSYAQQDKSPGERLRFFFDYLNFPEYEIALDAYREYAKADYKDYQEMAKTLPASKLVTWINDPKTPSYRLGLFASLLGHCGGPEEVKLLKKTIDDPEKRKGSGVDGMMAGLVMLDPKGGWAFLGEQMLDPKQDFQYRYSAFRTARFLWEVRPDLVPKEILVKSMGGLIQSTDMADFAIDELRKWKRWEYTQPILDLFDQKSHSLNVIRRAITRFAMRSPEPAAAKFVAEQRRRDAEWVKDVEDLLKLESN